MYDTTLGRFLQRDPAGVSAGDPNLFGYIVGRPTAGADPFGMQAGDPAAMAKPGPKDKQLEKPKGRLTDEQKKQLQAKLETEIENLKKGEYSITDWHGFYQNCIGLTCGEESWLWPPSVIPGTNPPVMSTWPQLVAQPRPEAFDKLYESKGYKKAMNAGLEGCKPECNKIKIALYEKDGGVTHAAIEDCAGKWDSKLGPGPRIKHATLEQLEGKLYGKVLYCYEKEQKGCNPQLCPKAEERKEPC